MKDPDDPGTFDMASVWGEIIPPRKPAKALIGKVNPPIIGGDEQKEKQTPGPAQVDTGDGQETG